jgi:predicted DCC family thiol-disulfide oxidoreductase YuxK
MTQSMPTKKIILFDGVCNLCDSTVQWIIQRDKNACFQFAALQSIAGQRILKQLGIHNIAIESIVLVDGNRYEMKSTAVLHILRELPRWHLIYVIGIFVPLKLRNSLYDFIARNRYRWFGQKTECLLPSLEIKKRFIQDDELS